MSKNIAIIIFFFFFFLLSTLSLPEMVKLLFLFGDVTSQTEMVYRSVHAKSLSRV